MTVGAATGLLVIGIAALWTTFQIRPPWPDPASARGTVPAGTRPPAALSARPAPGTLPPGSWRPDPRSADSGGTRPER